MRLRALMAVLLIACSGRSSPPVAGARVGLALTAALAAADSAREPWRCAAADGPGLPDETLTVGTRTWQLGVHGLTLGSADGSVTIGVIADAGGSAPATLAALGRLGGQLAPADLVIALGGMGRTRAELEAVYGALANGARWPLIALPGDLEPAGALAEAVAAVHAHGAAVIDGRRVPRIELPGATIAIVPGAGEVSRLAAGVEGCVYRADDVAAAVAELAARPGLRILASAEAPRDPARDAPTGELALAAGDGAHIDIALHGPTNAAASAARNGNRDGAAVSVTPGSSDAMPRLPGARRSPTAGVLTVRGNAWSWQPIADVK